MPSSLHADAAVTDDISCPSCPSCSWVIPASGSALLSTVVAAGCTAAAATSVGSAAVGGQHSAAAAGGPRGGGRTSQRAGKLQAFAPAALPGAELLAGVGGRTAQPGALQVQGFCPYSELLLSAPSSSSVGCPRQKAASRDPMTERMQAAARKGGGRGLEAALAVHVCYESMRVVLVRFSSVPHSNELHVKHSRQGRQCRRWGMQSGQGRRGRHGAHDGVHAGCRML